MGLDNGIVLKIRDKQKFGNTKGLYNYHGMQYESDVYELLYWRKCWNVRAEIAEVLADAVNDQHAAWTYTSDMQIYDAMFDLTTFKAILVRLRKIYKRRWWENNPDSIWEWDECGTNYKHWLNLAWKIYDILKDKDPNSYVLSFYDSY